MDLLATGRSLGAPIGALAAPVLTLERNVRGVAQRQAERSIQFVADAVVEALIEAQLIDRVVARLLEAGVVERVVTEVLVAPETEELVTGTLERPELENLIVVGVDSPATERIVRRVLDSPGTERAVSTVLESEEMQRIVEHIATSPEVRSAITQQSLGLADAVADQVRARSVTADDIVERLARRMLRRKQRPRQLEAGE